MKKQLIIFALLALCSCNQTNQISSNSSLLSSSSSDILSVSSSSDSTTSSEESSSSIDYSLFHSELIGVWYIHSSTGILSINLSFEIFEDYTMQMGNVHFNFAGIYDNFEETNLYISDSGITKFIVSYDGEFVDWAFEDLSGNQDFGTAKKEPFSNEIKYSYVGPDWPIEQINTFLNTTGDIPVYESDEYKLYTGNSQLYDADYAMIDIFNVPKNALKNYVATLNTSGFSIVKDNSSGFFIGYDENREYGLRLIEFNDDNLSIFVYNYETLSSLF